MIGNISEMYCTCGECHKTFKYKDAADKVSTVIGMPIKEKVCPHCGSLGYTCEAHLKYFTNRGEN